MGQVESNEVTATAAAIVDDSKTKSQQSSASDSMESLIAEAAAYGNGEDESLESKALKALECPCIAELRTGPCGAQFSESFLCFLKSTAEEKGSDCVHPFVALQRCIKTNPEVFAKELYGEDKVKREEDGKVSIEEYRIYPPLWAKEPQNPKPKL